MDDPLAILRRSSAVPNFVHLFNTTIRSHMNLPEMSISEYEHSLLPPDPKTEDEFDPLILPTIIIRLLKGCGQAYVREDSCFDILRSLAIRKWQAFCPTGVPCPFALVTGDAVETSVQQEDPAPATVTQGEAVPEVKIEVPRSATLDFHSIAPAMKAEVMLVLMNCWMMNYLVKTNFIDAVDADELRISPVGTDQRGNAYYYLCGTRLYKESNSDYDSMQAKGTFDWELIASEPDQFGLIVANLKKLGTSSRNRSLVSQLENKILPGLNEHFENQRNHDLERRMTLRRRRCAAVQVAREKSRKERQETMAMRKRPKSPDAASMSGEYEGRVKKLSRAERYQRRAMMNETFDFSSLFATPTTPREASVSSEVKVRRKAPMAVTEGTREELIARARALLAQYFKKTNYEWPV